MELGLKLIFHFKKIKLNKKTVHISLLIIGTTALLPFQNCSQGTATQESTFSSMSQASTIEQQHSDQDHGTDIPTAKPDALIEQKSMMDRQMLVSMCRQPMHRTPKL